eukprot:scaffold106563_cov60-Phaeocystis_antarctica.AAC.2
MAGGMGHRAVTLRGGDTRSAESCELKHVADEQRVLHNVRHGCEEHEQRGEHHRAERPGSAPGECARGGGLELIIRHPRQGVRRRRARAGLRAAAAAAAAAGRAA